MKRINKNQILGMKILKKSCCNCKQEYPNHSLEIHHIDGNHLNNDLNNLEVRCTICHRDAHYDDKNQEKLLSEKSLQEPRAMKCPRCNRKWIFKGLNKIYCTCPDCKSTIKIVNAALR